MSLLPEPRRPTLIGDAPIKFAGLSEWGAFDVGLASLSTAAVTCFGGVDDLWVVEPTMGNVQIWESPTYFGLRKS